MIFVTVTRSGGLVSTVYGDAVHIVNGPGGVFAVITTQKDGVIDVYALDNVETVDIREEGKRI